VTTRVVAGKNVDLPIDLIVPNDLAAKGGRRGARLGPHGKLAARKIPGLEAAVIDNNALKIGSLTKDDDRAIKAKVAGPTALLVAKAIKIQERLEDARRPDRILDKDAGDAYRLMQTSNPEGCARTAAELVEHAVSGDSIRGGVESLIKQFQAPGSPGTSMATRYFQGAVPEDRVRAVCTGFISAFLETFKT